MPTKFERIFHLARMYMRTQGLLAGEAIDKARRYVENNPYQHPTKEQIAEMRKWYKGGRNANS